MASGGNEIGSNFKDNPQGDFYGYFIAGGQSFQSLG